MKTETRKIYIMIALVVLALLSMGRGLKQFIFPEHKTTSMEVLQEDVFEGVVNLEEVVIEKRLSKDLAGLVWGRNPFYYDFPVEDIKNSLNLNGVSWEGNKPLALINDEIVGVGETLLGGSVKVIYIAEDHVILNDGQKEIKLLLNP